MWVPEGHRGSWLLMGWVLLGTEGPKRVLRCHEGSIGALSGLEGYFETKGCVAILRNWRVHKGS